MTIDSITIMIMYLKLCIPVICLLITMYYISKIIKIQNRITEFRGVIVDKKFFRHYECAKCRNKINIKKDNTCQKCGSNLF